MRFSNPVLEIDPKNPFAEDKLDREKICETLTQLVSGISEPFVLSVDAPWGEGKTTFLNMWKASYQQGDGIVIPFNAWETDFSDNALVALLGELDSGIKAICKEHGIDDKATKLFESAKHAGTQLVGLTLNTLVKSSTGGYIDPSRILSDLKDGKASLSEKLKSDVVADYQNTKKAIAMFRTELEKLAKELSAAGNDNRSVVICIDELDRCRPTYAVKMLETVKHLFSVPGIVFIIAIDREQVCSSVRVLYGEGCDADGYLQRFFDLNLNLPAPDPVTYIEVLMEK